MANKHATLTDLFTAIADSIRTKTGSSDKIIADNFPTVIAEMSVGGSGAYLWTRNGMADSASIYATSGTCTLTTPDASIPSSEIEYSASEPVYDQEKRTYLMPNSTKITLVNTDTNVPAVTNVYCRLTSQPNFWYFVTKFNVGTMNAAGTVAKSMAYSTKYTTGRLDVIKYVSDDDENK